MPAVILGPEPTAPTKPSSLPAKLRKQSTLPQFLAEWSDLSLNELRFQIDAIQLARAKRLDPNLWANHKGNELAKRLITVAAVQRQPVLFVGTDEGDLQAVVMMASQLQVPADYLKLPTSIGHSPSAQDSLKKFLNLKSSQRIIARCELSLELPVRLARDVLGKATGTPLDYAQKQIARVSPDNLRQLNSTIPGNLDESSKLLLKQAIEELKYAHADVAIIMRTASSIAAMERYESIQCMHVAEAVQYRLRQIFRG